MGLCTCVSCSFEIEIIFEAVVSPLMLMGCEELIMIASSHNGNAAQPWMFPLTEGHVIRRTCFEDTRAQLGQLEVV